MKKLILSVLLAACGTEESFTWGDATSELSEAFCDRIESCYGPSDRAECVAHLEFHFCLDGTCGEALPDEAEAETSACVEAMADADCTALAFYGIVPAECGPILDREPAGE